MTAINGMEFKPREFFSKEKSGPSKALGQNFITDRRAIGRIVEIARISKQDEVLEIGPGLGALTFALAKKAGRVIAIEKDNKLAAWIKERTDGHDNVEIISGDALETDFRSYYRGKKMKVVANLPYSVSSPILIKLLNDLDIFSLFVIMLQREVGERISSAPGGKQYGSISVLLQTYLDIKPEFRVPPAAFWPKPKVDSLVLKMVPLPAPMMPIKQRAVYEKVVRASFSSRRKMLGNSLKTILPRECVDVALDAAGIDRTRRAETLTIEEFVTLAKEVEKVAPS
jgi:16S rRNA (adenine1518-N6/adenine1519-N6)-dimethyltransferase